MKDRLKTFFAVLTIFAALFVFVACTNDQQPNNNNENNNSNVTYGEFNVEISTVDSVTYDSQTEMLKSIRPTVVDIRSISNSAASTASAGSGVIVGKSSDSDHYFIVTNHHVIDGGTIFYVEVLNIANDGTESTEAYEASLIGSSFTRDIAVLAISSSKTLSVASFIKDSDTVAVGTEVLAIGNPLGTLGGTVSHGIISATKRQVSVGDIGTMTLMQTDATINSGNSGGGLFDTNGALVGIINSGYETYNDQSVEGLNFAIPANDARYAVEELIKTYKADGDDIQYGYVEGDARISVSYSVATLYDSSAFSSRSNYLVLSAANESPLRTAWGEYSKVPVSITVNGKKTSFTANGQSLNTLATEINNVLASIKAGDTVQVEYKDVLQTTGIFRANYVDSQVRTVEFTAQQYIYEIPA